MPEQEKSARNVYISGGATPLALNICRQLTELGHSVSVLVSTSVAASAVREVGGLPVYGDAADVGVLTSNLKMTGADTVLNLAPMAFNAPPYVRRDWDAATAALRQESRALLDAAKAAEIGYIIHTSFAFLYADTDGKTVNENAPSRSAADNAFIKEALSLEKAVLGANGAVLRVGYLFGDSANDAMHEVATLLKRGLTPGYFGKDSSLANWLRTEDLAAAVVATVNHAPTATTYNIVSDTPLSVYGFISVFAKKLGLTVPANVPAFLASSLVGKAQLAVMDSSVALSNERAKTELGWVLRFKSVDAALEDMLLTWRAAV